MKDLKKLIQKEKIPKHVAIIMDGNGRWAKKNKISRSEGHKAGADVIEPLMDTAFDIGIECVSLYAFSTENWIRPKDEILGLWRLLEYFFETKLETIKSKGIRIVHSGSLKRLPPKTKKAILDATESTRKNKNLILNLCVNYGGQQEIVDAINIWHEEAKPGAKITKKKLEKLFYSPVVKDVDLLVRTSGEHRISNFLIWQIAYAEILFTDVLWPDFKSENLLEAVYEFQQRVRRFGGI